MNIVTTHQISSGNVLNNGVSNGRIVVYDWLRLIATFFVIIGHSGYIQMWTSLGGVYWEIPENVHPVFWSPIMTWIRNLSGWVYGFHMPLFFMLSGAVLAFKELPSFDILVKNKIKRLIIPYYVYGCLFMLPMKRIGKFYENSTLKEAMASFLNGGESGHLWFLISLFWCIIIFAFFKKLLLRFSVQSEYFILFLSIVIHFMYSYIPFDFIGLKSGLSYLTYFTIGYVFEIERRRNRTWNLRNTVITYIVLLIIELLNSKYMILSNAFVILVGCFMTFMLADFLSRLFTKIPEGKLWNIVISNLFYVYLFHDPLNYIILRLVFENNLLTNAWGCLFFTVSRTLLILFVSLMLGMLVTFGKNKIRTIMLKNKK